MSEATVNKSTMERYAIRNGHEWATICVREFTSRVPTGDREPYFGGEILINSSFGSWANTWNACGCRFKEFLTDIEFDYTFRKFMGNKLWIFDGEGTVKGLKERVIEDRKIGELQKDHARSIWDAIEERQSDLEHSADSFVNAMWAIGDDLHMRRWFSEPWEMTRDRYDPQAQGFWRDIWPTFKAELQRELEEMTA
jgi:hypothetical protein